MSRGTMSRRRGGRALDPQAEECPLTLQLIDESDRRAERIDSENAQLRDRNDEVEGWYRLLQAEHATLQERHEQVARKAAEVQAEFDRLETRNRQLEAFADRPAGPGRSAEPGKECTDMTRIGNWFKMARDHKWGAALALALATLIARDPGVQEVFSAAIAKVRQGGAGDDNSRDPSRSGYVRYAAMIQARDEAEKARADYNDRESSLKGDVLLEAQDRLRAAKARYRQARLAFLPELARRCEQAKLPVPREAVEALASLRQESGE
jgi:hypothetical protein